MTNTTITTEERKRLRERCVRAMGADRAVWNVPDEEGALRPSAPMSAQTAVAIFDALAAAEARAEAAERERDSAVGHSTECEVKMWALITRAEKAEASAAVMRAWAKHDRKCTAPVDEVTGAMGPCSCGLDAALATDAGKALLEEAKRYRAAIEWALGGEGSDFRGRAEGEGRFYWRKELAARAALSTEPKP